MVNQLLFEFGKDGLFDGLAVAINRGGLILVYGLVVTVFLSQKLPLVVFDALLILFLFTKTLILVSRRGSQSLFCLNYAYS